MVRHASFVARGTSRVTRCMSHATRLISSSHIKRQTSHASHVKRQKPTASGTRHCHTLHASGFASHVKRHKPTASGTRHCHTLHASCHTCASYVMQHALRIRSHTPPASRYASHVVAENQTSSKSSLTFSTRQTSHASRQWHMAFSNVARLMSHVYTSAIRRHTACVTRHV